MSNILDLEAPLFTHRYFGLPAEALWSKLETLQLPIGVAPQNSKPRSRLFGGVFRYASYLVLACACMLFLFASFALLSELTDVLTSRTRPARGDEAFFIVIGRLAGMVYYIAPLGAIAAALSRFSLAFLRPDATASLSNDNRRPIVLLRPFTDDRMRINSSGSWFKKIVGGFSVPLEAAIAEAIGHFGPLVAIGKPGEWIPGQGAQRAYLKDDEWHHVVGKLIGDSLLTVVIPGLTEGVRWELDAVLNERALAKTIFVMSPGYSHARHKVVEEFLRKAGLANYVKSVDLSHTIAFHSTRAGFPIFYGAHKPTEDAYITALLASVYSMFIDDPHQAGLCVSEDVEFRELVQGRELTLPMVQRRSAKVHRSE